MQDPHAGADITRLALAQPAGSDDLFDLLRLRCRQGGNIGEFFIQKRSDLIDTRICALGGQPHTHKKLPGFFIIQCAFSDRIFLLQALDHLQCQFFLCGAHTGALPGFLFPGSFCRTFLRGSSRLSFLIIQSSLLPTTPEHVHAAAAFALQMRPVTYFASLYLFTASFAIFPVRVPVRPPDMGLPDHSGLARKTCAAENKKQGAEDQNSAMKIKNSALENKTAGGAEAMWLRFRLPDKFRHSRLARESCAPHPCASSRSI